MSKHYAEKAVSGLAAYVRTNLPTYLRAVETEQELDEDTLPDPEAVIECRAPSDNRSPIVEVYAEVGEAIDERLRKHSYDCTLAWAFIGDADLEAGERTMMRCYTAMRRCLEADTTLGGTVSVAIPGRVEFEASRTSDAATRHEFALGVEIHTDDY
jgi:hypothetical protein